MHDRVYFCRGMKIIQENSRIRESNPFGSHVKRARERLVSGLSSEDAADTLMSVYGSNWAEPGSLPSYSQGVADVLESFTPSGRDALVIEEYRKLERVLPYSRRTLCLDLEGFLVERGSLVHGMREAIERIRSKHAVVVSSAAPKQFVDATLRKVGMSELLPLTFGDLASGSGKKYGPIAKYFGYSTEGFALTGRMSAEETLVAFGHSIMDAPMDVDIPFFMLTGEIDTFAQQMAQIVQEFK